MLSVMIWFCWVKIMLINKELDKKSIIYNKPTYTGFTILELSKCWLYELIYEVIKPNFKDVCLSYVDTDSCVFETSSGFKINYFRSI